jgi:hypothetical protein
MGYELTITTDNDPSSGIYESRLEAMDAVDEAAAVDGLTARYGHTPNAGFMVDGDGQAWFGFRVREVES